MTEWDIQRMAREVVNLLLDDDRFLRRMEKILPKRQSRMINSSQAASLLGISQWTLREIAPHIGGIKKGGDDAHDGKRSKWTFQEEGLIDRYKEYLQSR